MTELIPDEWLQPEWPVAQRVRAFSTTRAHEEDIDSRLSKILFANSAPRYLNQVHGAEVVNADNIDTQIGADAVWTCNDNVTCVVRTADCLPILLADNDGSVVAAVHAGWRGLLAGVISNTVTVIRSQSKSVLHAWIGPGISAQAYEVDSELRDRFLDRDKSSAAAFQAHGTKWLCDLKTLAIAELESQGVVDIHGGQWCTYSEPERFHSYRRDASEGRMLSMIWLSNPVDVTQ